MTGSRHDDICLFIYTEGETSTTQGDIYKSKKGNSIIHLEVKTLVVSQSSTDSNDREQPTDGDLDGLVRVSLLGFRE